MPRWTTADDRRLRRLAGDGVTDTEAAQILGRTTAAVTQRRATLRVESQYNARRQVSAALVADLGTDIDRVIAARHGVTFGRVAQLRAERGIPSVVTARRAKWTKAAMAQLGKVPDETLAKKFGVSRQSVHALRQRRGVPPLNHRTDL